MILTRSSGEAAAAAADWLLDAAAAGQLYSVDEAPALALANAGLKRQHQQDAQDHYQQGAGQQDRQ